MDNGTTVTTTIIGATSGITITMDMLPDNWLVHIIAGTMGAFLALAVVSPDTIKEAVFRLLVGMVLSFLFTNSLIEYSQFLPQSDIHLTAGSSIGFMAWFFLGALNKPLKAMREEGLIAFAIRIIKAFRGQP